MYLDWIDRPEDYFCIDVEADSLTPTVLYVMCWENIRTKETGECRGHEEITNWLASKAGSVFIGHNILKYDAPVLNRLLGTKLVTSKIVDTLVLSTLYHPSLPGGHSLAAWGERIGYAKIDFHDFSKLTEEMVTYCHRDVKICAELFRRLVKVMVRIGFSELSCEIQHQITAILNRQHHNGFYFDGQRAMAFLQQLRKIEEELQDEIRRVFPAERVLVRKGRMYTKTGSFTAIYLRDLERYIVEPQPDREYRAYEDVQFNIGSPKQRTEKLLALGWKPTEFTPKTDKGGGGNPKVTEASLIDFAETSGIPEIALIARWMSTNGRGNMVNTWLENWNEQDGCIHGKLFVADTLRFRHQAPNTANIPAVRVDKEKNVLRGVAGHWTYEARDLWIARRGRVLVGTDAAGLELRMLAHYINNPKFTEQVISGDPHQFNADTVGITRPTAKTLLYAIMYGAQGPKVAKTIGVSVSEGVRVRQEFLARLGIEGVMNDAIAEQAVGRVWLVDGSGVVCPSPHAALNYKLQGGGARVMSLGAVLLERSIRRRGLDCLKVGDVHDEWIYDVHPDHAEEHAALSVWAIQEAGRRLKLNVPLDGKALIGPSWAHVH
jgi:DNA polymerase-1